MTFIVFSFIIFMVMIMRKRIIIIGVIMLLVGVAIMTHGIIDAGKVAEEKKYSPMDPGEAYEYFHKMASGKKDPVPPLIILGAAVSVFGVIFLAKSKDEKFLPGI